jgi:hypothetical protein
MVGIGSLGLPTQQGMLYLEMNYDTLKFDYQSDSLRLIGQYLLPSSPTIKNFTLFDPITYDAFVQTEVYYEPYRIGKWVVIDENIKMHRYGDVSFLPMNCTCDGKSKLIRTSLSKYDGVPILDDEHTYVELCLTKGKEERINVGKGEGIFRLNRRNRIDFKYEMDDLLVSIEYVVPPQPTVEYHASLDTLTNQVEVNKISYYELYRTSTRILKGGKLTHFENKASFLPRPNICDSLYYRDIDW